MNESYTPLLFQSFRDTQQLMHSKNYSVGLRATLLSLFILFGAFVYNVMLTDDLSLRIWNRSLIDAGLLLIGCSLGLSVMSRLGKSKALYRRDLGLNGMYLILIQYVSVSLLGRYAPWYVYLERSSGVALALSLISALIFFMVALLSNVYVPRKLQHHQWESVFRLGYSIYIVVILHSAFWSYEDWVMWWGSPKVPPMSFVLFVVLGGTGIMALVKKSKHSR